MFFKLIFIIFQFLELMFWTIVEDVLFVTSSSRMRPKFIMNETQIYHGWDPSSSWKRPRVHHGWDSSSSWMRHKLITDETQIHHGWTPSLKNWSSEPTLQNISEELFIQRCFCRFLRYPPFLWSPKTHYRFHNNACLVQSKFLHTTYIRYRLLYYLQI